MRLLLLAALLALAAAAPLPGAAQVPADPSAAKNVSWLDGVSEATKQKWAKAKAEADAHPAFDPNDVLYEGPQPELPADSVERVDPAIESPPRKPAAVPPIVANILQVAPPKELSLDEAPKDANHAEVPTTSVQTPTPPAAPNKCGAKPPA